MELAQDHGAQLACLRGSARRGPWAGAPLYLEPDCSPLHLCTCFGAWSTSSPRDHRAGAFSRTVKFESLGTGSEPSAPAQK